MKEDVKEYLSRGLSVEMEIREWQGESQVLMAFLESQLKDNGFKGLMDSTSPKERYIIQRANLCAKRQELSNIRVKALDAIVGMESPLHRKVLKEYYLFAKSFDEIATSINLPTDQVIKAHDEAISLLDAG